MSKFNAGQTVRIASPSLLCGSVRVNQVATVERHDSSDNTYALRFEDGGTGWALARQLAVHVTPSPAQQQIHEFKPGDEGFTKGGDSFEVLAVNHDATAAYPLIVRRGSKLCEYKLDGRCYSFKTSNDDLVGPKKHITLYLNISAAGEVTGSYRAEAHARHMSGSHVAITAHPVAVELPC